MSLPITFCRMQVRAVEDCLIRACKRRLILVMSGLRSIQPSSIFFSAAGSPVYSCLCCHCCLCRNTFFSGCDGICTLEVKSRINALSFYHINSILLLDINIMTHLRFYVSLCTTLIWIILSFWLSIGGG